MRPGRAPPARGTREEWGTIRIFLEGIGNLRKEVEARAEGRILAREIGMTLPAFEVVPERPKATLEMGKVVKHY